MADTHLAFSIAVYICLVVVQREREIFGFSLSHLASVVAGTHDRSVRKDLWVLTEIVIYTGIQVEFIRLRVLYSFA